MKFVLFFLLSLTTISCDNTPMSTEEKKSCETLTTSTLKGEVNGCSIYQVRFYYPSDGGSTCFSDIFWMTDCNNATIKWRSGKRDNHSLGK